MKSDDLGIASDRLKSHGKLFLALAVIFCVPFGCFLIALQEEGALSMSFTGFSLNDSIAEATLLLFALVWIILTGLSGARGVAFVLLMIGFSLIAAGNAADLLDEFIQSEPIYLSQIENIAFPLGMFISSLGLWKWGRDYSRLLGVVNQDLLKWRNRASCDDLTGQFNRRSFFEDLPQALKLFQLEKRPTFLLMLDIDHFKAVNDSYGHPVGDMMLTEIGKQISHFLRKDDQGFRLGGEEFALVMHDADPKTIEIAANRLRERLENLVVSPHPGELISCTCSIGVAELKQSEDIYSWLKRADQALYHAKEAGRNRVIMSSQAC